MRCYWIIRQSMATYLSRKETYIKEKNLDYGVNASEIIITAINGQ